ncbi:MAG: tellurite resistance TerB family protein, partial [Pseudomonadota bacterium]
AAPNSLIQTHTHGLEVEFRSEDRMLNEIIGNNRASTTAPNGDAGFSLDQLLVGGRGFATGAAAGGLAAMLLGGAKPKKLAKNALKVGGVALVGGLAYKAWNSWQANKNATFQDNPASTPVSPAPTDDFLPKDEAVQMSLARSLMRAMISAAKADGHLSQIERQRLQAELNKLDLDDDDRAFVRGLLDGPSDLEAVVRDARTPELAAELYTASLLAVDPDGDAERGYLALLAVRLKLDQHLVVQIHAEVAESITTSAD